MVILIKIKKIDTKSELDIPREEANALRNNSKILKKRLILFKITQK